MDIGQSSDGHPSVGEDEGETVEIKIKTLDAQSYTLRVDKNTSVPALKERIASVVGVPVENQRLICRGKVLKDDQILAAYNVEDGHTLHLVARQPPQPAAPSSSSGQEQVPGSSGPSDMVIVSPRSRPGHVSHSLLMGTINIPDSGEGGMPDLNRIISAVLNSVGISNGMPAAPGGTGAAATGPVTVGVLPSRSQPATGSDGQLRAEGADPGPQAGSGTVEQNALPREVEARLHIDALYGVPSFGIPTYGFPPSGGIPPGIFTGSGATVQGNPFHVVPQPAVVPDALTTMSQYLDRLEQSFSIIEGGRGHNLGGPLASEGAIGGEGSAVSGQTSESLLGRVGSVVTPNMSSGLSVPSPNPVINSDRQGAGVPAGLPVPSRRVPTPSALGAIVHRVQDLLSGQAGSALSRLAAQLENEPNLLDAMAREEMQTTALRDGNMMQQLGALLLELGRTTLTLRLGQSPAESVVNAGPAVFISPSGPNPMMVQSLPLQTGLALGALPSGTSEANGGVVGPSLGPRSINIHIHTSDLRLPSGSPSPSPSPQQPPARAVIGVSSGAPALTVRQVIGGDMANSEHPLTVRQIIERAEAANGGNSDPSSQTTSGGAVQGAFMTFHENGALRVVPVRTRTGAAPYATHSRTIHDGGATSTVVQPLLARFQQALGSVQHGRPSSTTSAGPAEASTNSTGTTSAGEQPPSGQPSVRAQVHIQAWAPSIMQALGGSAQPVSGPGPVSTGESQGGASDSHRDPTILQMEAQRSGDGGVVNGQPADGLVQGVDVAQIVDSLGPFLNQLAVAFQQVRPQPQDQSPPEQLNEQHSASQPNAEAEDTGANGRVPSTPCGDSQERNNSVSMQEDGVTATASHVECSDSEVKVDKMDIGKANENAACFQDGPGSSSTAALPDDEKSIEGNHAAREGSVQTQVGKEDRPATPPIGLGIGGLQPLPVRSRRRAQGQPRQVQIADTGADTAAGNGLSAPRNSEQALVSDPRQNLLQSLVSQMDRPSNRPEGNAMEQSLGQLTQALLPLIGSIGNRGNTQGGEGSVELGDVMGQLMSRTGDGNTGQRAFPAEMLRGMMGQLVQSPLIENLVQQVMTGVHNEEAQDVGHGFTGNGTPSQGAQGGFDFTGIMQQMLPVVSQMFGGRPTSSAGQQGPSSANVRNHNDEGAARDSPGQTNDSGRWRETLSEEEATSWSETILADVEQQQSMEPQRPFSDMYVRGSPVAKRQKTDLDGTALMKIENGGPPEEALRTVAENVGGHPGGNELTNGEGVSHNSTSADGRPDAYMAVLFHDLAARVAADPDFGDGSNSPNATGVFEQQTTSQEPAGE